MKNKKLKTGKGMSDSFSQLNKAELIQIAADLQNQNEIFKKRIKKLSSYKKLYENNEKHLSKVEKICKLGMWRISLPSYSMEWSDELYNIFELNKDQIEITFDKFISLIHPIDRTETLKAFNDAVENKTNFEISFRVITKNEKIKILQTYAIAAPDKFGKPSEITGVTKDITAFKKIKPGILASEEKFTYAFNRSPGAMTITTIDHGEIIEANEAFCKLVGFSKAKLIGKKTTELNIWLNKGDRKKLVKIIKEDGRVENFETKLITFYGTIRDVIISADVIKFNNKKLMLTSSLDITESKIAEEKIIVLNRTLRTISEINQLIVREFNKEKVLSETCKILVEQGKFAMVWIGLVNSDTETITPAAQYGFPKEYKHSLDAKINGSKKSTGMLAAAIRTGEDIICMDVNSDKRFPAWNSIAKGLGLRSSAVFLLKIDEKIVGAINVNLINPDELTPDIIDLLDELAGDISLALRLMAESEARKNAETFLWESQQMLEMVINNIPQRIFWKDRNYNFLGCNKAFLRDAGLDSQEQIIGKNDFELAWKDSASLYRADDIDVVENKSIKLNYIESQKNNSKTSWLRTSKLPLKNKRGKVVGILGTYEDITDKMLADAALKENEERLRLALSSANQGLYDLNIQTGEAIVSDEYATMLGFNPAKFKETNERWLKRTHPDDLEISLRNYQAYINGKIPEYRVEFRQRTKSKDWKWILSSGKIVEWDDDGKPLRMLGTHTDITDRKNTEQALQESEKRFRSLFEHSAVGVAQIYTETGKFFRINKKYCDIVGYSVEEMLNMTFQQITYPEDLQNDFANLEKLKNGLWKEYSIEKRYIHKSKSIVWVSLTVSPLWQRGEKKEFHIAVVEDITQKKYADNAIQKTAKQYKLLFAGNPNPMFVFDRESLSILDANEAAIALYQYSREEFLNMTIKDIRPKEDIPAMMKVISELNGGITHAKGFKHKKKSGKIIHVDVTSSSVEFDGRASEVVVVYDITQKFNAEQSLKASEEKFRALFSDSHDCIYVISPEGNIINMNDAGLKLFGVDRKNILDYNVRGFHANDEERDKLKNQIDKEGFVKDYPIKLKNISGKKLDCLITASVRKNELGEAISYQGIIRDVTKQRENERELIKAKEEAERANRVKTEFLAQMSHEIRTPINTLLSFASLIKEETEGIIHGELNQYFNYQVSAGKRIIRTIDLVLNMSEVQTGSFQLNMRAMNLVNLINEIYDDYKSIAEDNGLTINLLSPIKELKILGDEYSIHQIFSNLIDNSIKYTPSGSITLILKKDKNKGVIQVIDTGIGMTEEYLQKIFQPFTQEEQGYTRRFEGSGLGLSLVKKYCDFNNAAISVESEKNVGSKFMVSFNLIE